MAKRVPYHAEGELAGILKRLQPGDVSNMMRHYCHYTDFRDARLLGYSKWATFHIKYSVERSGTVLAL